MDASFSFDLHCIPDPCGLVPFDVDDGLGPLVAFLWYNLAIYMHFLAAATPSTTTCRNEDTPAEQKDSGRQDWAGEV
jgi:hypothetical protein